jgi:hypothetical protein
MESAESILANLTPIIRRYLKGIRLILDQVFFNLLMANSMSLAEQF